MKVKDIMTDKVICAEVPSSRRDALKLMVRHNKTAIPVVKKGTNEILGILTRQKLFANPDEDQLALLIEKNYPAIKSKTSLQEAIKALGKANPRFLPVVDKNKLTGVITPSDFLGLIADGDYAQPAGDLVQSPCVGVYEETPAPVALSMMRLAGAYSLAVLNDEGKLIGLLTDRDTFNNTHIDATVVISDMGLSEEDDSWTWEGLRSVMKLYYEEKKISMPPVPVKNMMVKDPTTAYEKTPASEIAKLMKKNDYGQIPLKNKSDRLVSMIYEYDLLSVL